MESEMKELYVEGVATHDGPELCVGDPRGRSEALAGVRAGRAIEPRNGLIRGAHVISSAEGNIGSGARREPLADPAWSENHGMYGNSMRENREVPCSPAALITGRAARGTLRRYA
jgi:hypothetical protein